MYTPSARRATATSTALAPTWREILALVALGLCYLISDTFIGESSYSIINILGSLMMSAILAYGAWHLIRSDGKNLWTALFWFRLSTVAYFGIGTYLVFAINPAGRLYLETFYWFFDPDIFKLNLIVTLSTILVLVSARVAVLLATQWRGWRRLPTVMEVHNREQSQLAVGLLFLVVGLTVNYLIKMPYDCGWTTYEVPGSIMNLARLTWIGIFLITLWSLQNARVLLPLITVLVATELLSQLLLFSKAGVLFPLIVFFLAFLWAGATLKRVLICGALVIAIFGTLQPIVSYGRAELERRYGDIPQAGLSERSEILSSYFTSGASPDESSNGASAITRISYVNAATFVIQRYDAGHPGNWPELIPAVFIPRFLWPDKPVITDIGRDIYELASGQRTSQSGAGLFADAYWAMGWWGIIVFMPIYGLILGVLTVMSVRLLREGRWIFFPVILMGLQMGFRTDGHYIADVAGASIILAGTFAMFYVVDLVLRSLARPAQVGLGAIPWQGPLQSSAGGNAQASGFLKTARRIEKRAGSVAGAVRDKKGARARRS